MDCFNADSLNGACFSENRLNRYLLWRKWDIKKPYIGFLLLNPSIANENILDPTLKRCKGFAIDNDYGGMYIVNTFPLVSTDPQALKYFEINSQPFAYNELHIKALSNMMPIILGFGTNIKKYHFNEVIGVFKELLRNKEIYSLKITKDGLPSHPLYLSSNSKLEKYDLNMLDKIKI